MVLRLIRYFFFIFWEQANPNIGEWKVWITSLSGGQSAGFNKI